jgi:methionine sulfoxide reductase heme-binding subunit
VIAGLVSSHSKADWYLMRGTGMVALVLLTLTLTAGIAGVRRWSSPGWPRAVVTFVHRNVALLAVVFLALHVVTAVIDPYVSIGWLAAVVPLASHWDSLWVGLGAVSLDIMVALVATSLVRGHLSHRVWRTVHWLAYASWPLALVHGFESGTDSATGWARAVYIASIVVVAAAVAWRLRPTPSTVPVPAFAGDDPGIRPPDLLAGDDPGIRPPDLLAGDDPGIRPPGALAGGGPAHRMKEIS